MILSAFLFESRAARNPSSPPLGLELGQKRAHELIIPSAVWFNFRGERLGFGDINKEDVQRLTKELTEDYMFILRAGAAARPGCPLPAVGQAYSLNDIVTELPRRKLTSLAAYVFGQNEMYAVETDPKYSGKKLLRNGLIFTYVNPSELGEMIDKISAPSN